MKQIQSNIPYQDGKWVWLDFSETFYNGSFRLETRWKTILEEKNSIFLLKNKNLKKMQKIKKKSQN